MQNLIIGEPFDYIELFILAFLPLLYKLFFWLYTIQLKEYRWDRFKEYIFTKQGKSALFNIFFIIELILLIYYSIIWFLPITENVYTIPFWGIGYNIFFYYLLILNIFVLGKIFRKRILKPKFTARLIILLGLFVIGGIIDLYLFYKFNLWNFTYIYILFVFLLIPALIFFYNFISLPIVNYKKNKQINAAIKKSEKINDVIKIGITGSYGKSSVKEFLASILEQDGELLKTPENQNTEMSVSALVLNKLANKYKYFVAEMGAYRIGEISLLGKIVNHKYGFLTAIGNQHIGLFGSQENISKGKFEILEKVKENNGFLYVNGDCEEINKVLTNKNSPIIPFLKGDENIVKYGIDGEKLDAKSKIIEIKDLKTKFEFNYNGITEIFETNLIGEHNILNLTGILAFCYDIGLKTEDLKKYLLNIKKPKNTQEIFEVGENILIDDTYNLSEAGLKSGLNMLKYFKNKNKILVLDDILELGKKAKEIHYNIAKEIAEKKLVDKILFVGVNYKKSFINGLLEGGFNKENILSSFSIKGSTIEEGKGEGLSRIILFEGKKAKKYFNILKNKLGIKL